ncbi:MAG: hypothetical protein JW880_05295 [Candidatus Thermoplasmatota archaeon]|nr:hypothetical protein [Candidatus Thermoplasmatota archaeon]
MAKKIEEAEVKKECPSCGLGVALDSKICEFCGWDFEEEDEWILQIEKLERELMLEKKRFEPGSVDQKIEATLYTPTPDRAESRKSPREKAVPEVEKPLEQAPKRTVRTVARPAPSAPSEPKPKRPARSQLADAFSETIGPDKAPSGLASEQPEPEPVAREGVVRKAREVKAAPTPSKGPAKETGPPEGRRSKKVRVVRKVKK